MKVANSLGLTWIDGNNFYPIEQPAVGYGDIPEFPTHEYPSEIDATAKYAECLNVSFQLQLCPCWQRLAFGSCAFCKRAARHNQPLHWLLL